MEQFAKLSTGNCRAGSNPALSAFIEVIDNLSECSVARLSRRVWDAEVAGSNPATPTFKGFKENQKPTKNSQIPYKQRIWLFSQNKPT